MSLKEAPEGLIINGRRFNSSQSLEIIDMISEGEIEGLCSGIYKPEGKVGEFGWRKNEFERYNAPSGESDLAFLRSVYWNQTSVLDDNGRPNFQRVSVSTSNGGPDGSLNLKMGQRVVIDESFDPTTTIFTAKAFDDEHGVPVTFDSVKVFHDHPFERSVQAHITEHKLSIPLSYLTDSKLINNNKGPDHGEFFVRGFYSASMKTKSGKAYVLSLNLYAAASSRVVVLGTSARKDKNHPLVDVNFIHSYTQGATGNQFREIYIDENLPSCVVFLILVQTSDGREDTSASIKSADLKLVRDVSGKNKTIATVVSGAKEVKNFYLKASVDQSADLSDFKVIEQTFVSNEEGWQSLPKTDLGIRKISGTFNKFCLAIVVKSTLPQGKSGGAYLVVNSKLECGDGMSIRFPAVSQARTSKTKARLSIREDLSESSAEEIPELLGTDFEVTSAFSNYEFFFVASRPLSKFRIYITLPAAEDEILIDFFQVYKPMIQTEVLLDKSIEIYKDYELSFRGAGKYETETDSRKVPGMPLAIALSNGSTSAELITTSKDYQIIPLTTV